MDDQLIISNLKSKEALKINKTLLFWEKKYKTRVVGFVLRNRGDKEEGENIFYESLMDFYQNIASLPTFHYSAKLSTYFFRITLNKWLNEIKRRKNVIEKDSFDIDEKLERLNVYNDTSEVVEKQLFFRKLSLDDLKKFVTLSKKAIGDKCYQLLRLKYSKAKKYTYEEILGLMPEYKNIDTLKAMVFRCKETGRKKLGEYYQSIIK